MRVVEVPEALKAVHAKVLAYQPEQGEMYFALSDAIVTCGTERQIIAILCDADEQPLAGVTVTQEWPDGHESFATNASGRVEFFLGPGSRFTPPRGGPHRVYVGNPESLQSDLVYSLGSPQGQAVVYQLSFKQMLHEQAA